MARYRALHDSYGFLRKYWRKGEISKEVREIPPDELPVSKVLGTPDIPAASGRPAIPGTPAPLFRKVVLGEPDEPLATEGMPGMKPRRGEQLPNYPGMQEMEPETFDSAPEPMPGPPADAEPKPQAEPAALNNVPGTASLKPRVPSAKAGSKRK
jgi:hypothetical protein